MVVRASRRQTRHPDPAVTAASSTEAKLDAVLQAQKQTNELLTLLVRACVKTVQVPVGEQPPPNAVRVEEDGSMPASQSWTVLQDSEA
jgi:hypothetical protein